MVVVFINKNQMMAIVNHCPMNTFDLNHAIPLVKALKWSQGKKNSKGTIGNIKEAHRRQHHKAWIQGLN
jgi:hypothetical protein